MIKVKHDKCTWPLLTSFSEIITWSSRVDYVSFLADVAMMFAL